MNTFSPYSIATLSIALLAVACGGANANDSVFQEPGADAAAGSDTANTGGQDTGGTNPRKDSGGTVVEDTAAPDTGTPITAENVCTKLADAICTSALSTCCGTKGIEYNASGCRDAITKDCTDKQAAVTDGRTTFNADAYGACVGAWSALTTKCSVPILEFVKTYAACDQLFNGTTAFRDSCAEDYECKVAPGAYANCTSGGQCDSVAVVGNGAPCGTLSTTRAYCDYGLYCQYTSSSSGTCRTAKAIGATCNNSNECGFGNWCNRGGFGSSGTCAAGSPAGTYCSYNEVCASGECSSNRCTDPNVSVAGPAVCNGSGI
jgi:hypothetical protein